MNSFSHLPTPFIKDITTEDTGGHCMVDFVHLHTGQVLGIDDESVVLYANMDDFLDGYTEDRPSITLHPITNTMPHSHHLIFPYLNSACSVVFDDSRYSLHEEELCRGADTLWNHLRAELLTRGEMPDALPAIHFTERSLPLRHTRLYYLRTQPDGWTAWRVECPTLPELTELQFCPSLLHYFPDGPPPVIHLTALWSKPAPWADYTGLFTSSAFGASPSPHRTDSSASHPHDSPNAPHSPTASAPASSPDSSDL